MVSLNEGPVSKAIGRMIVDHANGLHERVADRRAGEFEPPAFQVPAHGLGDRRVTGHVLGSFPAIVDRLAFDELPNILIEAPDFLLNEKKGLRIRNSRLNFESIPDDSGVAHQCLHFLCVVSGD